MGELILGGHGVARGYVNRPDLTAEKFYPNPYPQAMPHWNNLARYPTNAMLYKTGDLVKYTPNGELEYFGRIDCQVKLRGFRVELGEIESVLCDCDNINTAIVHVWTDEDNGQTIQTLCAYVVLDDPTLIFSENEVKEKIAEKLATYMIPSIFVILLANEVPRLPSGKVNRKMLVKPEINLEDSDEDSNGEIEEIQTDNKIQAEIYLIWKKAFSSAVTVGLDSNFFKDLGGHSLLAARTISTMRENPALAKVGVKDLYKYPTIRSLAHFINPDNESTQKIVIEDRDGMIKRFNELPHRSPGASYWICSIFQFLSFYIILLVASFPLLGGTLVALELIDPFLVFFPVTWPWEIAFFILALIGYTGARIVQVLFCVLIKHVVMFGRYKSGIFPIYGTYYFRWWFVSNLMGTVNLADFHGTPLLSMFYSFFGCRLGKHVHIHTSTLDCMDLLTIDDGACISEGAIILGYEMKGGWIRFAKTHIGKNVTVGTHSVVSPGTILEDDSTLGDFSHAPVGSRIPRGETWIGSPAVKVTDSRADIEDVYYASGVKYFFYCIALFFGWIVIGVILFCLMGVLLKICTVGKMKPVHVPLISFYYIRKWMFDSMFNGALVGMHTLFATLYLPPWLRMMGAKIAPYTELSFFAPMNCEMMELDEGCFVADGVVTCAPKMSRGMMTTGSLKVGYKSFVGNQSVVPPNTVIESGCLLGVDSVPPFIKNEYIIKDGQTWIGNPPVEIPARDINTEFEGKATYYPSTLQICGRLVWEYFRIVVPIVITNLVAFGEFLFLVIEDDPNFPLTWWMKILAFPILVGFYFIIIALIIIAMKWIFMGRYTDSRAPLYSSWVRRTELCTGIQEQIAGTTFMPLMRGTFLASLFFRLMGSKVGKKVYWDSFDVTEHDLVEIGDEAIIGPNVTLQSHLFEDRVMKCGKVRIGARANLGTRVTVLYDTSIGDDADVGPLSLVMKGEQIAAKTKWAGLPITSL
ncbi:Nonribosomal peptide synthetase 4 [Lobulomyces angularis]|nr:Nonribosomal peptide synthetase 4 [Lobulomyces angularis]